MYKDCTYCTYEVPEAVMVCPACESTRFGYWHVEPNGNAGHSFSLEGEQEDPTEGSSSELEVEIDDADKDPAFCSYLKNDMKTCGAKTGNPCGRHDTEKQIKQEAALKEMIVEAFNRTKRTNYSVSDLNLRDNASAFEFLCASFRCLITKDEYTSNSEGSGSPELDSLGHKWDGALEAYVHTPVSSDFPPKDINVGQLYCQKCEVDLTEASDMIVAEALEFRGESGPSLVNHVLNHPKVKTDYDKVYDIGMPVKVVCPGHVWDYKYKDEARTQVIGRFCTLCSIPFTLNVRDD